MNKPLVTLIAAQDIVSDTFHPPSASEICSHISYWLL